MGDFNSQGCHDLPAQKNLPILYAAVSVVCFVFAWCHADRFINVLLYYHCPIKDAERIMWRLEYNAMLMNLTLVTLVNICTMHMALIKGVVASQGVWLGRFTRILLLCRVLALKPVGSYGNNFYLVFMFTNAVLLNC